MQNTERCLEKLKITNTYSLIGGRHLSYKNGSKQKMHELLRWSENTIFKYREKGIPCFVLKDGDEFWGCVLSKDESFGNVLSTANEHLCSSCGNCRSLKVEEGGCSKVRDWFLVAYQNSKIDYEDALVMSKRIEKYDFIRRGYELINTPSEIFDVIECENFRGFLQRPKMDFREVTRIKQSVMDYYLEKI